MSGALPCNPSSSNRGNKIGKGKEREAIEEHKISVDEKPSFKRKRHVFDEVQRELKRGVIRDAYGVPYTRKNMPSGTFLLTAPIRPKVRKFVSQNYTLRPPQKSTWCLGNIFCVGTHRSQYFSDRKISVVESKLAVEKELLGGYCKYQRNVKHRGLGTDVFRANESVMKATNCADPVSLVNGKTNNKREVVARRTVHVPTLARKKYKNEKNEKNETEDFAKEFLSKIVGAYNGNATVLGDFVTLLMSYKNGERSVNDVDVQAHRLLGGRSDLYQQFQIFLKQEKHLKK